MNLDLNLTPANLRHWGEVALSFLIVTMIRDWLRDEILKPYVYPWLRSLFKPLGRLWRWFMINWPHNAAMFLHRYHNHSVRSPRKCLEGLCPAVK